MEQLIQGGYYAAYAEPKKVRDANPSTEYPCSYLWIIQIHTAHYTILVLLPSGKFDIQKRPLISLEARLNNGQIVKLDSGHFPSCKI